MNVPEILNQHYSGNDSWVIRYGCALCSGINMASYRNGVSYSIANFAGYYSENDNGYSWTGPGGFSCSVRSLSALNEADTINAIRSYVAEGKLVACHAVGSSGREHWFVPVAITGSSGGTWATAGLDVHDPYNPDFNSKTGRTVPISDAMDKSSVTLGIDKIRISN